MSNESSSKTSSDPNSNPVPLDCSKGSIGVWLVKVPKYLAEKWNTAPENAEVGRIRITQSKGNSKEVSFHLNHSLGQAVTLKVGDRMVEEKIPLEHKFVTAPLGSQNVFILKQTEENAKESLSIVGKVMQRAECTPVQDDHNYLNLKREITKKATEPKRQMKILTDNFQQRNHFHAKPTHLQNLERKEKVKRLKRDKSEVLDLLFNLFTKEQFYNIKDLEKKTKQPTSYLKDILHEICKYNAKGPNKNTWELKDEYKHSSNIDSKKTAAAAAIDKKKEESKDDYMEDDDDDEDLSDSDLSDDNDEMIETM